MAKKAKKTKLEDYVELHEDFFEAAGNIVGGTRIAKELAPMFFQHMKQFDEENLSTYTVEHWYLLYFVFLMGAATGEKNSEAIRSYVKLSDAKPPIRLN
jgi:hypothetical protein